MHRLIAGGTGFIGHYLINQWRNENITLTVIGRSKEKIQTCYGDQVRAVTWAEFDSQATALLSEVDCIVNLVGANIGEKRWSEARKNEIIQSRVDATQRLALACAKLGADSPPLYNASAVGIYGLQTLQGNDFPEPLDEDHFVDCANPPDFLSTVGCQWERAAEPALEQGVPVIWMRFGVVLDGSGGALQQIALPFRFGLGGRIGSGRQPFSWIALPDLCRAMAYLFAHPAIVGPVNLVAPGCITQRDFATALGRAMHRPSVIPTPGFVLKGVFGQMADELLLRGQHVYPKRLEDAGFIFKYPDIASALSYCFM